MDSIQTLISRSTVHTEWQPLLVPALSTIKPEYLQHLLNDEDWLPGIDYLLSAFRRDLKQVKYLLIGESPYPRQASANGIAFYDAAVGDLWSENGLSKAVNRATSMRNILKMALLAEGHITPDEQGKIPQSRIAEVDKDTLVQTMAELFESLHRRGFLMLNATPVLHPDRKPVKEAIFWQDFLKTILELIATSVYHPVTLILWGKIAEQINAMPQSAGYNRLVCEHPYNLSFIDNSLMRDLFAGLKILKRD